MSSLDKTRGAQTVAPSTEASSHATRRILVVEDDKIIRQLSATWLASSGYQVAAAENGAAGWEALHANDFDLLITDHAMPKLTGLELVKKVRSAHMTLPVILATGVLPEAELERHPWLQLSATLLKPYSPQQLLQTVQSVLHATAPEPFPRPTAPFQQLLPGFHLR